MPALNELMELRPLAPPDDDELKITGSDPVLETKFRLAETAAAALASVASICDLFLLSLTWDFRNACRAVSSPK